MHRQRRPHLTCLRRTRNTLTVFAAVSLAYRFFTAAHHSWIDLAASILTAVAVIGAFVTGWRLDAIKHRQHERELEQERARAVAEAEILRRHQDRFDRRRSAQEEAEREAEERGWWADEPPPSCDEPTIAFGKDVVPLLRRIAKHGRTA